MHPPQTTLPQVQICGLVEAENSALQVSHSNEMTPSVAGAYVSVAVPVRSPSLNWTDNVPTSCVTSVIPMVDMSTST
jgi:hypothetical protein